MVRKYIEGNKPLIETLINSCALAMTAFAIAEITRGSPNFPFGYLALVTGIALEYFKYVGRHKNLW